MRIKTKVTVLAVLGALVLPLLSGAGPVFACTNGCTPGFWKQDQHFWAWTDPYDPSDPLSGVFDIPFGDDLDGDGDPDTLLDALNYRGGRGLEGAARILLRTAVATLLTSAYDAAHGGGWDYSWWTPGYIIEQVNDALDESSRAGILGWAYEDMEEMNELGCPL